MLAREAKICWNSETLIQVWLSYVKVEFLKLSLHIRRHVKYLRRTAEVMIYLCWFVSLSVRLYVCLSDCLCVCLSVCLCVRVSVYCIPGKRKDGFHEIFKIGMEEGTFRNIEGRLFHAWLDCFTFPKFGAVGVCALEVLVLGKCKRCE